MLQVSHFRQICLQLNWPSHKARVAQPQRGKNPKLKVLGPIINSLGLKSLNLLAVALSVVRKAIELRTAGKNGKLQSLLVLAGKNCTEKENSVPK